MSTTIENQVVSMQFDNKHFESNVKTSLSTLDKLKRSLKFPGAAKGFEDVSAAAKKVNLSPIGNSVEKVGLKFNAMYTVADQVFRNITNRAQQTAENLVKSFTIEPVKAGFQEYETQLNAVQTILANTQSKGENLETVNAALDELNKYADQTIYNFTEMTRNIGTFTAAGVGLKESTNAIKGIANLAAVSGSSSQQASTAMYQLSQALAAGKVSLMDWNSVVNAGMGGELFQEALKRTARNLGTGVDEAIKKYGTFRESLTQGEWLTKEVLTETLAQLSGAYTEADLIAQGYTQEQAAQIAQLAETASDAATKVKTFTQLMDTLKESAQSGWTSTWELLVGDFEEAKELWTGISEVVGGFIGKSADRRNTILGGALNNNWEKLIEKVNAAGVETTKFEERVKSVAKSHNIDVDKIIAKHGSLEDAFRKGAISTDILKEALGGLTAAGEKVKDIDLSGITKTLKMGQTSEDVKKVEEALQALGYNLTGQDGKFYGDDGFFGTLTEKAIREFQAANNLKVDGIIGPDTLKALDEAVNKTKKLDEAAGDTVESFEDLVDNITELGGREKLIRSFKNIFKGLSRIIAPIGKAFDSVFGLNDLQGMSDKLFGVIDKFHTMTAKFNRWTRTTEGKAVIDGLTGAFKGLFNVVKLVGGVIGGLTKGAFTIFGKIFSTVGLDIIKLVGHAGNAVSKFTEWITASGVLTNILSKLATAIGNGVEKIRNWIKAFFELPQVQDNLKKFKMEFSEIINIIKGRFGDAIDRFKAFFARLKEMDGFSFENIKTAFSDFFTNVLGPLWKNEDGSTIFDGLINSVKNLWTAAKKYFVNVGTALGKFGTAISTFFSTVKKWIGDNAGGLLALASLITVFLMFKKIKDAVELIAEPLGKFGDLAETLGEGIERLSKAVSLKLKADAVKSIAISIGILAASLVALTLVDHTKLLGATAALLAVIAGLGGLLWAVSKFSNNLGDVTKLAVSLMTLSGALLIFAFAAKVITGVEVSGLAKTGAILVGFLILAKTLSKTAKGTSMAGFGIMMLKLSAGLLILSVAVGILGRMKTETLIKGGAAVGTFLFMMAGMMKATKSLQKDLPRFGTMMAALSASLLIMSAAVGILGNMDTETLVKGGVAIAAFLGMIAGMMAATKLLSKDLPRFGSSMFGLSAGLLAMALAVKVIAGIKDEDLIKGGLVITAFLGMMVGMMAATKLLTKHSANAGKIGLMMLSFAGAMVLLTGSIAILSMIDGGDLAKATAVIAGIGLVFAGMVALTKFAKVGKGVKTTIITMAVAIGVLAISIAALSFVDTSKLMGASVALGIVMGMFSLMSLTAKAIGIGGVASVLVLTGIVAILGYIIKELADIPADGALKVVGALSMLILSLSASCLMLGAVGATGPAAFIGIGVLAALMAVIGLFAGIAIASLPKIGDQLSKFMDNLSGFLDGAERITPDVGTGLKNLAEAIITLTSAGIMNALMLGTPLGVLAAQLKPLGKGLKDFADSVNDCDIDSSNVDAAVKVAEGLAKLAGILPNTEGLWGWFAGKEDIGGFGDKLGQLGKGLAAFANSISAEDFTTDNIDSAVEVAEGLAKLASILPNTEDFWGWISGQEDLSGFGTKIEDFGSSLSAFASSISSQDFTTDNIDSAVEVAEGLAKLSGVLPNTEGFLGWLNGQEDLSGFGTKIEDFAFSLASFANAVSTADFTTDNIDSSVKVAEGLAKLSSVLPNTEGLWGWFIGKEDIASFGDKLSQLGFGLTSFANIVSTSDFTTDNIDSAVDVAEGIAKLSSVLPNTEDLWGWLNGKEDVGSFGDKLGQLGTGLATFANVISSEDFTANNIDSAVTVAEGLAKLSSILPNTEDFWGWLNGKEDVASFGDKLGQLGEGLTAFATAVSGAEFSEDNITAATGVADTLSTLAKNVSENSAGWDWLTGKDGLDAFGSKIESLGKSLAAFGGSVSGETFNVDSVATAVAEIEKMMGLAERLGGENVGSLADLGQQISDLGWDLGDFSSSTAGLDADKFSAIATGLSALASINIDNADNIEDFIDCLGDVSADGVDKFAASFEDSAPKVIASVSDMLAKTILAIKKKGIAVKDAVKTLVSDAAAASDSVIAVLKFMSAGYSMAEGFARGISSGTFMVRAQAIVMAEAALAAARSVLKINSPSKVFIPVGEAIPEGMAMGIDSLSKLVTGSTVTMAKDAIDGTKSVISRIADAVNMDLDAQPTIRPVLDLSEIESGVGGINGMFGMRPSVGVLANIGSINSMMNRNNQNRTNDDIVSAIHDLGRKIGESSGDTNIVNGVTYDDGSNITTAVRSLVRAVKMERRT